MELDPIKYELFYSRLMEALFDAKEAIRQLAASEIVREAGEAMECLCLPDGESVLVSSGLLAHVASVTHNIRYMINEKYDQDVGINDGDQFIGNDCHIGGMHIPDMMVISPLFYEGELIGWLGNGTHVPEVGAIEPGGMSATATEFWHEGLCMPCVKIVENGKVKRDIMNMMRRACRDPRGIDIDTRAKVAGNERAKANIMKIIDAVGIDFYKTATHQLVQDAEIQARTRVKELAKGKFRARCFTDCVSGSEQKIRMAEIEVDITDEGELNIKAPVVSPQAMGYNNCAYPALEGLIFCTLLWQLFYDARWNSGCLKALNFDIPKGSLISADESAAVAYAPIGIGMQVMGCFNEIISRSAFIVGRYDDIIGPGAFLNGFLVGGMDRYGRRCASNMPGTMMLGSGARHEKDGLDTSFTEWNPWTDFGDVEPCEIKVPAFHLGRRHIPDSGGPGKYRGGAAGEQVISVHASPFAVVGQAGTGGYLSGVQGMYGGYPAPKTSLFIARNTDYLERAQKGEPIPHSLGELMEIYGDQVQEVYPASPMMPTTENDIVASQCWGGGGSGDVIERDPADIVQDIRNRVSTVEMAKDVYCVSIDPQTLEVNEAETRKLREAKKKERLSQGIPGQEFIAKLVERREKRDFPGPTLAFFDELMAFSPSLKDQLDFEKAFSERDLPKLDVNPVKDIVELTPYVKIVEDEKGDKYAVCSQCGHVHCKADENFKLHALISDRDAKEIHKKHQAADPDWMIYREFYCPGCGSLVEVEGTPSCCPILYNVELSL
jgi:N-methylhydantoinase B/oxoprolinase/acetone carboxylase alpha subunit